MEKYLVVNTGSTSLKYKLYSDEKEISSGHFENVTDHKQAVKNALKEISDLRDIRAIGHRIVHGGNKFHNTVKIDEKIFKEIESLNDLAPLHNPYSLAVIKEVSDYLPDISQYAVFDTAFFNNLPDYAFTYALPKNLIKDFNIRRYGFHGISHNYSLIEASRELGIDIFKINLITCHLGGGSSITAIKRGQPIETSMGFTPMEGLVMGTRTGDIDPGIIFYLIETLPGYITEEKIKNIYNILNHESGLKGLTGKIDFREILKEYSLGNADAKLAMDIYVNKIVKYIGSYWAMLEGQVDGIVFTGAIGAGNPMTKNLIISKLKFLGETKYLSIMPNEELMIVKELIKQN